MVKIIYLTDEIIQLYSGSNVLTTYKDTNGHYTRQLKTIKGGVYDASIFGSMFSNQCNCGQVRTLGIKCPRCKSKVLDSIQAYRRYARIDLPVYYCSELKIKNLIEFLTTHFEFRYDIDSKEFETKLDRRNLEILQFNYDEKSDTIIVTDKITDVNYCSYEGLLHLISSYHPELLNEYRQYINMTILVVPMIMRPPIYTFIGDKKVLKNDSITVVYQNILYAIIEYYDVWYPQAKTESGKAIFKGTFRRFIDKAVSNLSRLLATSKENLSRQMQSTRMVNSGRCTIVPAPDLKVDEVYIPIHLMYEVCRDEFIKVIMDNYGCDQEAAELKYKTEANTDEIQKLFQEYIDGDPEDYSSGKFVFINRNPTLHELNIMMCKVKLTRDYCMKIPMAVCKPYNADFDGDTMSFYAIPKKANNDYLDVMSPKNLIYFKKSHDPLFLPTHEFMMGLIYATKVQIPEKIEEFNSYEEANQYRRKHRDFKYQTQFLYQGNLTTMGRMKLSELFGTDLDVYIESLDWKEGETHSLNSKNIIPLYSKLADVEDRTDRIQKIQEFAAMIATLSGATAPTLTQLYSGVDSELFQEIKRIEKDPILSAKEKDVKCRDLYTKYVSEQTANFDDSVKLAVNESSRAKIGQLMNIVLPQFNVSPNGEFHISETRLIQGMDPKDLVNLAIENRAVQDIKVDAVPLGGYLTHQFVYLALDYSYIDEFNTQSRGVMIPMKDAEGRYKLDGTIIPKSNSKELVEVASIVTSTSKYPLIYKNMIPSMFHYKIGSRIGISLMTSLTEGLTQAGLSLKHGGALFQIEPEGDLRALEDCIVSITEGYIVVQANGQAYAYPKPANFTQSFNAGNKYKKGEIIGSTYKLNTPAYRLDSIIKMCEAKKVNPRKKFARNTVLLTDCYATQDGIISYKPDNKGQMRVFINNEEYVYDENAMYLFPNGAKVKKYDRICSGTLNMHYLLNHVNDRLEAFYYFRKQFNELINGISSELIEFLFVLLVKRKGNQLKLIDVVSQIRKSTSFYISVSFGYAKDRFRKVLPSGEEFLGDTISNALLSLIINNEIQ